MCDRGKIVILEDGLRKRFDKFKEIVNFLNKNKMPYYTKGMSSICVDGYEILILSKSEQIRGLRYKYFYNNSNKSIEYLYLYDYSQLIDAMQIYDIFEWLEKLKDKMKAFI